MFLDLTFDVEGFARSYSVLVAADESFPNDPTRVAIAKYVFAVADSMLAEREK